MAKLLKALIYGSERAANVARSCCNEAVRDTLLVAEKDEKEANVRFETDFKTIADVLAQESARFEIASRCPELELQLRGEERAEINGVAIEMGDTEEQTAELLTSLMPANAAKVMAQAAHAEINITVNDLPTVEEDLDLDFGIWIDPIDATAEFISGVRGEAEDGCGLPCVTVLIGAYSIITGQPVMGVINQPFVNGGKGRVIWGLSYGETNVWSGIGITTNGYKTLPEKNTVVMSTSENPEVIEMFKNSGWEVEFVPGAGNKLRKVAVDEAAAHVVSKGSTFRWDTCAPHAILKAKGGDILCYTTHNPITYNDPDYESSQQFANAGGVIAYSDANVLNKIMDVLK